MAVNSIASLKNLFLHQNDNTVPPVFQSSHLPSLDGLRGISILIVVLGHAFNNPEPLLPGSFGVSIFFVISGFLITTLLLKERSVTGNIDLGQFYVRRFLRIFPVAYLYLFILLLLTPAFDLRIPGTSFLSAALYLRNTTILYAPLSEWYTGHYWSLSVEEQFYLVFPFLLKKSLRIYVLIIIVLLIIIPFSNSAYDHHLISSRFISILSELLKSLSGILIGSLFAILLFYKIIPTDIIKKHKSAWTLILFCIAAFLHARILPFIPANSSQPFIALLIIPNITKGNDFVFKILNTRILVNIGKLSYSLYIWQQLFTNFQPWRGMFKYSDSIFLNLIGLAVASYLSYNYYEKFFLKLKARYSQKKELERKTISIGG